MKFTENIRLQLRLTQGALLAVFGLSLMAAVSTHQLLLDAANHPTSPFDLTSTNLTGTLDAGRLPAAVPLLDGSNNLSLTGQFDAAGGLSVAGTQIADGTGTLYAGGISVIDSQQNAFFTSVSTEIQGITYTLIDGAGDIFGNQGDILIDPAGNAIGFQSIANVIDGDGLLITGTQSYQVGMVTPTGYILMKDAAGTIYQIPAVRFPNQ